jgi:tetratricopeptide (TPR) repeat protein
MYKRLLLIILVPLLLTATRAQIAEPTTADAYFTEGLRLLRNNSFEAALVAFEKSATLDPKEPSTFANIGVAAIALKRYEKAEDAFRTASRLAPTEAEFRSELCRALSLQKKHAAAIEACEEGVRLAPNSEEAHEARLIAFQSANRLPELQRYLDLAVAQFRNSELILMLAVDHYLAERNYSYAVGLQESLVALKPSVARHHGVLAEIYLRLDRDADSLRSARTALRLEPINPYANYAMGLIFFEFGQHEEAIESFRKVQTNDPRLSYASYYRAVSETRRGRPDVAIEILQELNRRQPDNIDFVRELASTLSQADRFDESRTIYLQAKRLDPKSPEILIGLGMSYMMRGDFPPAIENFDAALRLQPGNSMIKMFVDVSRGRQNLVARLPDMLAEVDENSKDVKRLREVASVLAYANRFDEAEKYLNRIYALDPADYNVYHMIGVTFSEMGRNDKALVAYKKAVEKGQYAGSYFAMGAHYRDMGDFDQASAAFAKGIELKPDTPNFMKMYADMLQQNGKRREALEMYKRSLALLPANPPVLFDAAVLSAKLGDKTAALAYLGTLKTVDPTAAKKLEFCLMFWI